MQDTFARATHSAKRARDDRVSCIQGLVLLAFPFDMVLLRHRRYVYCSEECSLQLILSEHIRSGRRLLHFCYHAVHQRDRASKPHRPSPSGMTSARSSGFTPSSSIRPHYKFHGVGKGRPRPILHVLLGRSPLQRRRYVCFVHHRARCRKGHWVVGACRLAACCTLSVSCVV